MRTGGTPSTTGPVTAGRGRDHAAGLGFEEARRLARTVGEARTRTPVDVGVAEAVGGVLAEPLLARCDVPVAAASAMDGYAVRGPGPWRVRGRVLAGDRPAAPLAPGDAVEVATGALVPDATDRVLPVEVVALDRGRSGPDQDPGQDPALGTVRLVDDAPARSHVRPRGEECSAGDLLLPAGHRVRPAVAGLAGSTGSDRLLVRPRPRVAALVTGDELVTSGLPVPGQVRDAVGPLLPGAVAALGGDLVGTTRCGDGPGELDDALAALLGSACDVAVTCGMAGAGPADRLRPWLARVGAELVVDGVDVRPGHPQVLAVLPDGRPLVGLPGNPLAAVSALLTLLAPLLAGMVGEVPAVPARAVLVGWEPRGRPTTSLVPVRRRADGTVEPSGPSGPAQLRGLAAADAVAVVPSGADPAEPVELLPAL